MSEVWIYAELVAQKITELALTQEELIKLQIATEQEEGCIQFSICQVNESKNLFTLWEHWIDENSFRSHLQAAHTKRYFALGLTKVKSSHRLSPLTKSSTLLKQQLVSEA